MKDFEIAILRYGEIARMQDCEVARLWDCEIVRFQDREIARSRDCKITRLRYSKIAEGPEDCHLISNNFLLCIWVSISQTRTKSMRPQIRTEECMIGVTGDSDTRDARDDDKLWDVRRKTAKTPEAETSKDTCDRGRGGERGEREGDGG